MGGSAYLLWMENINNNNDNNNELFNINKYINKFRYLQWNSIYIINLQIFTNIYYFYLF